METEKNESGEKRGGRGKREEKIDAEERSSMILPSFAAAEGADYITGTAAWRSSDVLGPEKEDRALAAGAEQGRLFVMVREE